MPKKPGRFDYNIIIIGGGAAGLSAAYLASFLKAKVALVEKKKMGGAALHTGCVPSKTIISVARNMHDYFNLNKKGIIENVLKLNFSKIINHIRKIIQTIQPRDSFERYRKMGVDCFNEEAKIITPYQVKVGNKILTTKNIIIATGAKPRIVPFKGLDKVKFYTSDDIWDLKKQPKNLTIIGGGTVGCEVAQAFARLGTKVKIIQRDDRILEREDIEVSRLIEDIFKKEGIEVFSKCDVEAIEKDYIICNKKGKKIHVRFDTLMLALGRTPDLSFLEGSKLKFEYHKRGGLLVDKYLRTSLKNIYACGDVNVIMQLVNVASYQAVYATINALSLPFIKFKVQYDLVPWATFINPEVARIGINEKKAQKHNMNYRATTYELSRLDRSIIENKPEGFVKVITKGNSDKILGVTIVGHNAGEMISEFILAMNCGIGLNKILNTLHIYPTLSEANKYVAGMWKRAISSKFMLKLFYKFNKFRRE
jgi:pyruvate/2-oxoglutarate dehydrogenase complex dihydrolipoamide dehydrogenase (E3) component